PTPPASTPFPYTTLFRSGCGKRLQSVGALLRGRGHRSRVARHFRFGEFAVQRRDNLLQPRDFLFRFLRLLLQRCNLLALLRGKRSEEHTSELQSRENLVC